MTGRTAYNSWLRVEYEPGHEGWVRRSAATQINGDLDSVPVVETEPAPESVPAPVTITVTLAGITVREAPSFDAPIILLATNDQLIVTGRTAYNSWLRVEYEPGHEGWVRRSAATQINGDLDSVPVVETEPAPESVPAPVTITVTLAGITVREAPSFDAPIILLATNDQLIVTGRTAYNSWLRVEYEPGHEGWVRRSAATQINGDLDSVPVVETEPAPESVPAPVTITVTLAGITVREAPSFDAPIMPLATNDQLIVTGRTAYNSWLRVEYEPGKEGWVRRSAATQINGDLDTVPVVEPEPAVVAVIGTLGGYLRAAPTIDAELIATIDNVTLPITGRLASGVWYRVEWEGREAWISRAFITRIEGDTGSVPVVEPEPAVVAVIGILGGYLRAAPTIDAELIATIDNVTLPITGRLASGVWYRVEWEGREAWISRAFITRIEGDMGSVPVVEPEPAVVAVIGNWAGICVRHRRSTPS